MADVCELTWLKEKIDSSTPLIGQMENKYVLGTKGKAEVSLYSLMKNKILQGKRKDFYAQRWCRCGYFIILLLVKDMFYYLFLFSYTHWLWPYDPPSILEWKVEVRIELPSSKHGK